MAIKNKFKTDAFEAIHSQASALYKVGTIKKKHHCHFERREKSAFCTTTRQQQISHPIKPASK